MSETVNLLNIRFNGNSNYEIACVIRDKAKDELPESQIVVSDMEFSASFDYKRPTVDEVKKFFAEVSNMEDVSIEHASARKHNPEAGKIESEAHRKWQEAVDQADRMTRIELSHP